MNIRDLKYLSAIAQEQHFGKAAEKCHVTQPTLSSQIIKLEEYLGVKLIERTNKKLFFTPVGKKILDHAEDIIAQTEQIKKIAQSFKDPFAGELRLGIIPTIAPYFLPKILPKIRKKYPNLAVKLIENQTHVIVDDLRKGTIDACILALPIEEKKFKNFEFFSEDFYLTVPSNHSLSKLDYVDEKMIEGLEVLLLEDGHCLREQALEICHKAGAVEKSSFTATSLETLRQVVASGLGITLVPEMARIKQANVVYIPFRKPTPTRSVGMIWRTSSFQDEFLEELAIKIKDYFLQ